MGKYLVNHLRRITLVFACLQCDQYTIANIYNLHVLTYHQEEQRLPFADLVANDVGLFSEEAGEIAFSLLARSTLGDSVEDKHTHLANNFCALGAMRSMDLAGFAKDDLPTTSSTRTAIEKDASEVRSLGEHFRGVLRALADSSFATYPSVDYLKRNHRLRNPLSIAPSVRLVFDPAQQLGRVWPKMTGLDRDWGQQFADRIGFIVPNAYGVPVSSDEDPGDWHVSPIRGPSATPPRRRKVKHSRRQPSVESPQSEHAPILASGTPS